MDELFTFVIFPLIALLLGIGSVAGITAGTGLVMHWRRWAFSALILLTSLAGIGAVVLTGRKLVLSTDGLENVGSGDVAAGMTGKLLLVSVIGIAVVLCAARIFDFNGRLSASRFHANGKAHPTDITTSFMCFLVAYSILPIFFGMESYFHPKLVYSIFIYLAIFLWLPLHPTDPVQVCKVATGMFVVSSLLVAVVRPEMAIQPAYNGSLIPGFNIRLWGTTAHANSLGAVTSGYLLLQMALPSRRRWLQWLMMTAGIVCLILSQSKTSILCVLFGGAIIYGTRIWNYFNRRGREYNGQGGQLLALIFAIGCVLLVVFASLVMFGDGSLMRSLEHKLNPAAVHSLSSGTGRFDIWAAAINAGMQNPLFGQGADYWNEATRLRLGLSGAASAHNQFLQAFSLSGLVGLVSLLVFYGYLLRYCIRGAKASGNATIAMFVALVLRSVSETPIAPHAVLAAEFFATTAYIIFIIDRGARPLEEVRRMGSAARAYGTAVMRRPS